MSTTIVSTTVSELSTEEGWAMFDKLAQSELGVSAEEFLRALDDDQIPEAWSVDAVSRLEILLPFVR